MKLFMSTGPTRFESMLRILCAALMLSLGFAHKPVMAAATVTLDEAYRLPDGTFAEICSEHLTGKPSQHGDRQHSGDGIRFCEACLLASSILLPTPDNGAWLRADAVWLENAPRHRQEFAKVALFQTNHARGPPAYTF